MRKIRIKETYGEYDACTETYQRYIYTLDDHWFEYWIDVNMDGVIYCNDCKLNKVITRDTFNTIITNKNKRLEFMNNLIVKIESFTEDPFISRCCTTKKCNVFDKNTHKVLYNGDYFDLSKNPYHYDNCELVIVDYNSENKVITLFDYISKNIYTSTVVDNIFEVESRAYSSNLFLTHGDDLISAEKFKRII